MDKDITSRSYNQLEDAYVASGAALDIIFVKERQETHAQDVSVILSEPCISLSSPH